MRVAESDPSTRNNINLLRLVLAALVLFSHSFELIDRSRVREPLDRLFHTNSAGDLAVDGFFLISGFLILQSWQRDPHVLRYLARRVLRIYPAFIAATLLCGLVLGPIFGGSPARYFAQFQPGEFVRWMLLLREPAVPPVFVGSAYVDADGPMWTIQYEFMCYVLVAIVGLAGAASRASFWWLVWVAAMALHLFYSDLLNQVRFAGSWLLIGDEPASFVRFLTFFSAGALMFLGRDVIAYRFDWAAVAFAATFAALFRTDTAKLLLPTAGAYLLFWCAFRPLPPAGVWGAVNRFVRRNDLSYGAYLLGWPVQQILIRVLHIRSPWWLTPLAAAGVAPCAYLSWHWIERPFLQRKPTARG